MWNNLKIILAAFTNTFVEAMNAASLTATTVKDTVQLVNNEVINLSEEQGIRLDEAKATRSKLLANLSAPTPESTS